LAAIVVPLVALSVWLLRSEWRRGSDWGPKR
jgi:hypothetical protein